MSSLLKTVIATAAAFMVGVPLSLGPTATPDAQAAVAIAPQSAATSSAKLDATYAQLSDQMGLGSKTGSLSGLKDNGQLMYTQNALIYAHDSWQVGVPIKRGKILDAYAGAGYENGWLGYPITLETGRYGGGIIQEFQGGWIKVDWAGTVTSGGGRYGQDIPQGGGAGWVSALYTHTGASEGRLGTQTSPVNCGLRLGGCFAAFTGGEVWGTPLFRGAEIDDWRIIHQFQAAGWENGWLGYPVDGSSVGVGNPVGGEYVNFEFGSITVDAAGRTVVSQKQFNAKLDGDNGCSYAQKGDSPYRDAVCWIDMSQLNEGQARSADGQGMTLKLDGGYTAKFSLKVRNYPGRTQTGLGSYAVPTYYASGLGHTGFESIAGQPALLTIGQPGSGASITIDTITVTDVTGARVPDYAFVTGDSESTEAGETVMFRSDKNFSKLASLWGGTGRGCDDTQTRTNGNLVTCVGPNGGSTQTLNGPYWPFSQYDKQRSGNILYYSYSPGFITQDILADTPNGAIFGFLVTKASTTVKAPSDARGESPVFTGSVGSGSNSATVDANPGETKSTDDKVFLNGSDLKFRVDARGTSPAWYKYNWSCTRNGRADPTLTAGADDGNELTVVRSKINFGDRISCTANVQLCPVTFTMRDRYWRQ